MRTRNVGLSSGPRLAPVVEARARLQGLGSRIVHTKTLNVRADADFPRILSDDVVVDRIVRIPIRTRACFNDPPDAGYMRAASFFNRCRTSLVRTLLPCGAVHCGGQCQPCSTRKSAKKTRRRSAHGNQRRRFKACYVTVSEVIKLSGDERATEKSQS